MKQLLACFSKRLEDGINSPLRFMTQVGHANYKRTTLAVLQPKIKTNRNFQHMNKPYQISSLFVRLVVKNKEGAGERERERGGGGVGFITS